MKELFTMAWLQVDRDIESMKNWSRIFLHSFCIAIIFQGLLLAQTTDPVKIAQLQARFQNGVELEKEGKLNEALDVFLGIIKDEPKARGSLFFAGMVKMELNDPESAIDYLTRFRELEPKDFKPIILLIQANQSLRRTIKVDALRKELFEMRSSASIPGLSDVKSYTRERIRGDKDTLIEINDFFDYKSEPNFLFMGEQASANSGIIRSLVVFYNTDESAAVRAKNPKFADVEVFDFGEQVIKNGKAVQINIYRQEYEKPTFDTARKWILDAIKAPPKPITTIPLQSAP